MTADQARMAPMPDVLAVVLAACLLAFLPASLQAQDRILTLSIVNFNSLLLPSIQPVKDRFPIMASPEFRFSESLAESQPALPGGLSFAAGLFENRPFGTEPVLLTRTVSRTYRGILDLLDAGYGQIFYDRLVPDYTQHGAGQEEPTFGYLKITFRF